MDFLDELGNFKQKKILHFKMLFFLHFTATDPMTITGIFISQGVEAIKY